mmetsp:Transcript_14509/g.60547  ORF Transcript_14509/g.60547 Transcript_14509/m.60547 type:complete len:242 (+) Transcript_14509:679-1404(+)
MHAHARDQAQSPDVAGGRRAHRHQGGGRERAVGRAALRDDRRHVLAAADPCDGGEDSRGARPHRRRQACARTAAGRGGCRGEPGAREAAASRAGGARRAQRVRGRDGGQARGRDRAARAQPGPVRERPGDEHPHDGAGRRGAAVCRERGRARGDLRQPRVCARPAGGEAARDVRARRRCREHDAACQGSAHQPAQPHWQPLPVRRRFGRRLPRARVLMASYACVVIPSRDTGMGGRGTGRD